jgi:SAM-dependent methyltransferase
MKFLEGDIGDLEWAENEGVKEGMFDVITCASAFVVLEDQAGAVNCWAKLLKKGGSLIFDIPTGNSMVKGLALERIASQVGVAKSYIRGGLDSEEKVRALLTDAGLDDSEFFLSESYEDGDFITVEGAGATFDGMVAEKKWFRG